MRNLWYIAALLMGVGISCNAYALPANPWVSQTDDALAQQENTLGQGLTANPWEGTSQNDVSVPLIKKKQGADVPVVSSSPSRDVDNHDNVYPLIENSNSGENDGYQNPTDVLQDFNNLGSAVAETYQNNVVATEKKFKDGYNNLVNTSQAYGKKVQNGYDSVVDTTQSYGKKIKKGYDEVVDTTQAYGKKIKDTYNTVADTARYYGRELKRSFNVLGDATASLGRSVSQMIK